MPAALAVAGSMNSADHAGTFSNLVAYLREQVAFRQRRVFCELGFLVDCGEQPLLLILRRIGGHNI